MAFKDVENEDGGTTTVEIPNNPGGWVSAPTLFTNNDTVPDYGEIEFVPLNFASGYNGTPKAGGKNSFLVLAWSKKGKRCAFNDPDRDLVRFFAVESKDSLDELQNGQQIGQASKVLTQKGKTMWSGDLTRILKVNVMEPADKVKAKCRHMLYLRHPAGPPDRNGQQASSHQEEGDSNGQDVEF